MRKSKTLFVTVICLLFLLVMAYHSVFNPKYDVNCRSLTLAPRRCSLFTEIMPKSRKTAFKVEVLAIARKRLTVFLHKSYNSVSTWLQDQRLADFHNVLELDPDLHFLEIGSNLAVHSLVASSLKRSVVALDASRDNLLLLDASLRANGLRKCVSLVYNGVSGQRVMIRQGLHTILASDLLEVIPFRKAVLKIDIEKQEYDFFRNAHELFKQVDFPIVIMEWLWFSRHPRVMASLEGPMEEYKVNSVIRFFLERGYKPYSNLYSIMELPLTEYMHWPIEIVWMRLD